MRFKLGDSVKSPNSLWSNDIGTVSGVISNDIIHVIFSENDKHHAYQQTFNHNQLFKVNLK